MAADTPVTLTATEASRHFAAILERARHGESFAVTRNGEQVARILPPVAPQPNGAAILAFLESWEPDGEGFTDEVIAAMDSLAAPQGRDEERLEWVDDYR